MGFLGFQRPKVAMWVGGARDYASRMLDNAEQGTDEWDWWFGATQAAIHMTQQGAQPRNVQAWLTDGHLPPVTHDGYVQTWRAISEVVRMKRPPFEPYDVVLGQPKLGSNELRIPSEAALSNMANRVKAGLATEADFEAFVAGCAGNVDA